MKKRKGRLAGCLLGMVLGMAALFPAKVEAGKAAEVYVETKITSYNGDGTVSGWNTYEYDGNGNKTKYMAYDRNGTVSSWHTYEYDGNGNKTKQTFYNGDGTAIECDTYEYDGNGNKTKETHDNGSGIVYAWYAYEYDGNGNQTKATVYDGHGTVIGRYTYEYDGSGNRTKFTSYDVYGTVKWWKTWEYDGNGNQTKYTSYDRDGTVIGGYTYEYDGNGNQTKYTWYGGDGTVFSWHTYEYDGDGNKRKETEYDGDGTVTWRRTYEYDGNGNQTKVMVYDGGGCLNSYTVTEYTLLELDIPEGENFAVYEGYSFYKDEAGNITCYDSAGEAIVNEFKCDGTYTYFFQADGTAMKDRLSYHPDGEHVIYFDKDGHEVFSDFANVKRSIADTPVDDFCFFDIYGYLYVDVVTYDKTGTVLYYANPYGVMERGKWFRFSDTVMYPGQNGLQPWEGAAGGYGYANGDGTLMTNQWTYDWEGRRCYMQGNGVALYE